MKKFSIILIVLFLASCGLNRPPLSPKPGKFPAFDKEDSLLGYLNEHRKCYDVTYYDLDLKIEPERKAISGMVKIHYTAKLPVKKMQIDLAENMQIDSILDNNNQKLSFKRTYRAVTVKLKNMVMIGGKSMIKVYYHGKPQVAKNPPWKGGMVWKKKKGKWFCGVACEDDGASIWWPCKDHVKDKADSVQVRYTVPEGHTCVGNGRLVAHEKTFDGFEKFTWRTSYPINNYNVSFYIGDYQHFELPYSNGGSKLKKLDFYVLKENVPKAKEHFKQAIKIIKVYEELFGFYPWWKDGYKLVESPYEGMEHQTAIAYGQDFKNDKFVDYDYIILHETAHEWWGNHVTACDMSDLWIHEGFATYAEMLYVEKTGVGMAYHSNYLMNRFTSKNKLPLVGPRGVAYTNFKDNDIYYKGAAVLYMLRKTINSDPTFFKILMRFSNEYADQCVYTEHLMALVNEETGKNYDWFFEQYAFRAESPELFYSANVGADSTELFYKWNTITTNDNFGLPIALFAGDKTHTLYPSALMDSITIPGNFSFDEEAYVIFTKKKNIGE